MWWEQRAFCGVWWWIKLMMMTNKHGKGKVNKTKASTKSIKISL
jgi:hypothetical protein